jgi:TOTE conflict system, Archaeo-Eukaryotic Primase domain/Primase C terminal 1 (PriCT-1)
MTILPEQGGSSSTPSLEKTNGSPASTAAPATTLDAGALASPSSPAARFQNLFRGSERTHGVYLPKRDPDHITRHAPPTPQDFIAHLEGREGLGIVPIRPDGTCVFGAIDIDDDTIDHKALFRKVSDLGLPLTVCRSKSGGAHCYLFARDPGYSPSHIIAALKHWSTLLGHSGVEIFPKQIALTNGNVGNWINLPYFDCENTIRYAVGKDGSLTLDEFLDAIVWWDGKMEVVAPSAVASSPVPAPSAAQLVVLDSPVPASADPKRMPPCLEKLVASGVPPGARNNATFNFAVFLRKAYPEEWEGMVPEYNEQYCQPPLSQSELGRIVKSVGATKYQYRCSQPPISSLCEKPACLLLSLWRRPHAMDGRGNSV